MAKTDLPTNGLSPEKLDSAYENFDNLGFVPDNIIHETGEGVRKTISMSSAPVDSKRSDGAWREKKAASNQATYWGRIRNTFSAKEGSRINSTHPSFERLENRDAAATITTVAVPSNELSGDPNKQQVEVLYLTKAETNADLSAAVPPQKKAPPVVTLANFQFESFGKPITGEERTAIKRGMRREQIPFETMPKEDIDGKIRNARRAQRARIGADFRLLLKNDVDVTVEKKGPGQFEVVDGPEGEVGKIFDTIVVGIYMVDEGGGSGGSSNGASRQERAKTTSLPPEVRRLEMSTPINTPSGPSSSGITVSPGSHVPSPILGGPGTPETPPSVPPNISTLNTANVPQINLDLASAQFRMNDAMNSVSNADTNGGIAAQGVAIGSLFTDISNATTAFNTIQTSLQQQFGSLSVRSGLNDPLDTTLEADINTFNLQVGVFNTQTVPAYENTFAAFGTQLTTIEAANEVEFTEQKAAINLLANTLKADTEALLTSVSSTRGARDALASMTNTVSGSIQTLQGELDNLGATYAPQRAALAGITADINGIYNTLGTISSDLEITRVDTIDLNAQVGGLQATAAGLTFPTTVADASTTETQFITTWTDLSAAKVEHATLNSTHNALVVDIGNTQTDLNTTYKNLAVTNAGVGLQQVAELRAEVTALDNQVTTLIASTLTESNTLRDSAVMTAVGISPDPYPAQHLALLNSLGAQFDALADLRTNDINPAQASMNMAYIAFQGHLLDANALNPTSPTVFADTGSVIADTNATKQPNISSFEAARTSISTSVFTLGATDTNIRNRSLILL